MKLIVCLDDKNGMAFHNRRQSRDKAVCAKILELAGNNALRVDAYSRHLFPDDAKNIFAGDSFLTDARQDDYCFVETANVTRWIAAAERIIIFRWNRVYPADLYFPVQLLSGTWRRAEALEFAGYSHDKITQEVYVR